MVEEKWMKLWDEHKLFQGTYNDPDLTSENKKYLLFAFAYPSGEGLHVGHAEPYTALDILARYYRMKGMKPFWPIGWDAFGLPAENYAIKTGVHPSETTKRAIKNFSGQIRRLGVSCDWETEIATCHPDYYKWTQWLFLKLYEHNKAYKANARVNWCGSCQTVLANEQVVNGECERCGTIVVQKDMDQWMFRITDYKDELINDLEQIDWPEATKKHQTNWIGRSEGAEIDFEIEGHDEMLKVFTTRPDTIYGVTFMGLAPEHPLVSKLTTEENAREVRKYVVQTETRTEEDRIVGKIKLGVFTGAYAINPINGKRIPIWLTDYVLGGYGTGAIMGVPAHDDRDYEFARRNKIEMVQVISPIEDIEMPYSGEGKMINSDEFNGLDSTDFKTKVIQLLESKNTGKATITYKLRDWLISRQRYWGAPIPIVYDPEGKPHPVKEEHLPWLLPTDVVDFNPKGESPLRTSVEFKERVEKLYGEGWTPEYDTMDTFVDSSWYYLRYVDPRNPNEFAQKSQIKKLMPVDFYMIGAEHTVLHLLYSRFFTKFLRDIGLLDFDEPFVKMRHQGLILGPNNRRMSKSRGNVINPDEVVEAHGADTLRMYEMFMGPIDADKPWDTNGVVGVRRFLSRIWNIVNDPAKANADKSTPEVEKELHKSIKKVGEDIENTKFNTSIAKLMELLNLWEKDGQQLTGSDTFKFLKILSPLAPFISDELYESVNNMLGTGQDKLTSIHLESWPEYDENLVKDAVVKIVVQVNGKVRGTLVDIKADTPQIEVEKMAIELVQTQLEGKKIEKIFYVENRLINLVV